MIKCIRFYDFFKLLDEPNKNEYYLDEEYYELDTLDELLSHNPDRFYNIIVERVYGANKKVYEYARIWYKWEVVK